LLTEIKRERMIEKESFDSRMHRVVHHEVDVETLLKELKVKFSYDLSKESPTVRTLLHNATKIVSKFIFIERHFDYYYSEIVKPKVTKGDDFYTIDWVHLWDQLREVKIESLHSLLNARIGMLVQATNTLRRCFELSLYAAFFATTFYELEDGTKINPFVVMSGTGIWSENIGGNVVARRELDDLVKKIKAEKSISKREARGKINENFTWYYLSEICKKYCKNHHQNALDEALDPRAVMKVDSKFTLECDICQNSAEYVLVEKPPRLKTMMEVVAQKLKTLGIFELDDIGSLYKSLSIYLHPNPTSHQHEPEYKIHDLKTWLELLELTLGFSVWLYTKGMAYLGYKEIQSFSIFEKKDYDLKKITLEDLKDSICRQIGEKYNKK